MAPAVGPVPARRHVRGGGQRDLAADLPAADHPGVRVHPVQLDHPDRGQRAAVLLAVRRRLRVHPARPVRFRGRHRQRHLRRPRHERAQPGGQHRLQGLRRDRPAERRLHHGHRPGRGHPDQQRDPVPDLRPGRRGLRVRHHQLEPCRGRLGRHRGQIRDLPQRGRYPADAAAQLRRHRARERHDHDQRQGRSLPRVLRLPRPAGTSRSRSGSSPRAPPGSPSR